MNARLLTGTGAEVRRAAREARAGRLPPRYADDWLAPFYAEAESVLVNGGTVLDVGGGRAPRLAADRRPARCHYVGLDSSGDELRRAPAGSYDEIVVSDISIRHPELERGFDLVLCWQVLEHVKPLATALENIWRYLRPGGRFVAMLSSSTSAFALANRILPARIATGLVAGAMERPAETVHRAYYDHCRHSALRRLMAGWTTADIVSEYRGAGYFGFSVPLQTLYVAYEELTFRAGWVNLATHYRINATR